MVFRTSAALVFLLLAGCGASSQPVTNQATKDSGTTDGGSSDSSVAVERGPKALSIGGDPNGLFWDDATQTLFIADDNGNRILKWTDTGSFSLVKELPAASPSGAGLGQVVRMADGTLVVTRFGYGTAGDVAYIPAPGGTFGDAKLVPNLDVQRRRIGLALTDSGQLVDSWFVKTSGPRVGAVGYLALAGTEPEVVTGLQKPVGVLALGTDLYISDQDLGQILKAPLANPKSFTVFATVATPDLLSAGPHGSIFTGSTGGNLYRISAAGVTSIEKSGFQEVRGVAYDAPHKRLFVADHDSDESNGITHFVHILPVD